MQFINVTASQAMQPLPGSHQYVARNRTSKRKCSALQTMQALIPSDPWAEAASALHQGTVAAPWVFVDENAPPNQCRLKVVQPIGTEVVEAAEAIGISNAHESIMPPKMQLGACDINAAVAQHVDHEHHDDEGTLEQCANEASGSTTIPHHLANDDDDVLAAQLEPVIGKLKDQMALFSKLARSIKKMRCEMVDNKTDGSTVTRPVDGFDSFLDDLGLAPCIATIPNLVDDAMLGALKKVHPIP